MRNISCIKHEEQKHKTFNYIKFHRLTLMLKNLYSSDQLFRVVFQCINDDTSGCFLKTK